MNEDDFEEENDDIDYLAEEIMKLQRENNELWERIFRLEEVVFGDGK